MSDFDLNYRRVPFRLLQDEDAKLSYIAVYIAILKNMNYKSYKSNMKINEIAEIAGVEAKTVTRSINFLSRKSFITHKKSGREYIYNVSYAEDEKVILYDADLYTKLKSNDAAIFVKMLMIADINNTIRYKITKLAEKANVSFRTLKESLVELEKQGLIRYEDDTIVVKNELSSIESDASKLLQLFNEGAEAHKIKKADSNYSFKQLLKEHNKVDVANIIILYFQRPTDLHLKDTYALKHFMCEPVQQILQKYLRGER